MPTSESQKRAVAKYDAANTRKVTVKLNRNTDKDILDWLEKQDGMQTAIKVAIREKIAREGQ